MLLYGESVSIEIPQRYKNLSELFDVREYQYLFSNDSADKDDIIVVDLMERAEAVVHVEEILGINEMVFEEVEGVGGAEEDRRGLEVFGEAREEQDVFYVMGKAATREKKLRVFIGGKRTEKCDVILSVFREEGEVEEMVEVLKKVRIVNDKIFEK